MTKIVEMRDPTYGEPEDMDYEIADFMAKFFVQLPNLPIERRTLVAATLGAIAGATADEPECAAFATEARRLLINYLRCMEAEARDMPVSEPFEFKSPPPRDPA
jgi:hypothetical protein